MSQLGRLGSFACGIPLLFVRSDLLAEADAAVWDSPMTADEDLQPSAPGAKGATVFRHELRHFHDALIVPMLIEQLVLELERNNIGALAVIQEVTRTSTGPRDDQRRASTGSFNESQRETLAYRADAHKRWEGYRRAGHVPHLGSDMTFLDLLEINALLVELYMATAQGASHISDAWSYILRTRPRTYTATVEAVAPTLEPEALNRLHRIIMAALCSRDPITAFTALTEPGIGATGPDPSGDREIISSIRAQLADLEGLVFTNVVGSQLFPAQHLAEAVSAVLDLVVLQGFDLGAYEATLPSWPIPPTCFYADDEVVAREAARRVLPFVRKSDLRDRYGDVFTITSLRDKTRRTTVACGLVPTLGHEPFVSLGQAHLMLFFRYASQRLFDERVSYNLILDNACRELAVSQGLSI